jgi:hypothetical protein
MLFLSNHVIYVMSIVYALPLLENHVHVTMMVPINMILQKYGMALVLILPIPY